MTGIFYVDMFLVLFSAAAMGLIFKDYIFYPVESSIRDLWWRRNRKRCAAGFHVFQRDCFVDPLEDAEGKLTSGTILIVGCLHCRAVIKGKFDARLRSRRYFSE